MSGSDGVDETSARVLWLRAGQRLLRSGGVGAVKIHSLRAETGLTTGSFYHHFDGMAEYLEDLADFWGPDTEGHIDASADPDPLERIRRLVAYAPREDLFRLDRAMRDWAGSEPRAAAAVERVDAALLTFIAEAFVELGFDLTEARLCAQLLFASAVARVSPPWPATDEGIDRVLDILTRSVTSRLVSPQPG